MQAARPPARAGGDFGLHGRQLCIHFGGSRRGVQLLLDVVLLRSRHVGECARCQKIVDCSGARLHLGDLVLSPLHGHACVGHRLRDARHGLTDTGLGLGGLVGGLHRLFLRTERLYLRREPLRSLSELGLLGFDLLVLRTEALELLADRRSAAECFTCEILVALGEGLLGL